MIDIFKRKEPFIIFIHQIFHGGNNMSQDETTLETKYIQKMTTYHVYFHLLLSLLSPSIFLPQEKQKN